MAKWLGLQRLRFRITGSNPGPNLKFFMKFWHMPIFGHRSFSCYYFFIYSRFDMYGACSIAAGDHKFLSCLKLTIWFKITSQVFIMIKKIEF
jgi:hypothetical protein